MAVDAGQRDAAQLAPGILCTPPPNLRRLALYKGNPWPAEQTEIHVRFLDGEGSVWARVVRAITGEGGWNRACGMQFVFDQSPDAQVRVTFAPGGSWSHVGNYALPQSEPTMQLGWLRPLTPDYEMRRVSLHEFGHALGFIHEHQQPNARIPWDLPAMVAYYRQAMGWDEQMVIDQVITPYAAEIVAAGAYDAHSIMHYAVPREFVTDPAFAVAQNFELSAEDKALAAAWYGAAPVLPEPPVVTPPPGPPAPEPEPPDAHIYLPVGARGDER